MVALAIVLLLPLGLLMYGGMMLVVLPFAIVLRLALRALGRPEPAGGRGKRALLGALLGLPGGYFLLHPGRPTGLPPALDQALACAFLAGLALSAGATVAHAIDGRRPRPAGERGPLGGAALIWSGLMLVLVMARP